MAIRDLERAAPFARLPARFALLGLGLAIVWVAMGEIDRLIGELPDASGRVWPLADLTGPARLLDHSADGWLAGFEAAELHLLQRWASVHLLLDLLAVACYLALARRAFGRRHPDRTPMRGFSRWALGCVALAGVADLVENTLALGLTWSRPEVPIGAVAPQTGQVRQAVAQSAVLASSVKWVAFVLVALILVRNLMLRRTWQQATRRYARALWCQRYSALTIVPVAALSVVPGPEMLDQLPDVQRQWLDDPAVGAARLAAAAGALAVLVLILLFLGRWRADQVWREAVFGSPYLVEAEHRRARLRIWLLGPALALALAVVVHTQGGYVAWARLGVFVSVPLLVLIASLVIRHRFPPPTAQPRAHRQRYAPNALDGMATVRAGDAIAVLAISLAGLGLVRAMTAPFVLSFSLDAPGARPGYLPALVVLLVGGAALTVLPVMLANPVLHLVTRAGERQGLPSDAPFWRRRLFTLAKVLTPGRVHPLNSTRWVFLVASVSGFVAISFWAEWLARNLGFLAATVTALASLVLLLGFTAVVVADRRPPELFQRLTLSSTPVLLLFAVAVVAAGAAPADETRFHGVRGVLRGELPAGSVGVGRPTMQQAFDAWLARPSCGSPITVQGRTVTLRPMLLVAAEGGGIRAAYWTARSLELIRDAGGRCGSAATLFSAGASGGATGLTVSRFSSDPSSQVVRMSGPEALATATTALFTRDVLTPVTGISVPLLGSPQVVARYAPPGVENNAEWRVFADRAALMESVWQGQAPALAGTFSPPTTPGGAAAPVAAGLTGHLILNSTTVAGGCRAFLSQIELPARASPLPVEPQDPPCDDIPGPGPHSIDLLADFAGAQQRPGQRRPQRCLGEVRSATAAMLASRFPYVTPSGVLGPCGAWSRQQLVDGGYVENSGIATITDLADLWLPLVREHNAAALARFASGHAPSPAPSPATDGSSATDIVVPVVVFLDDGAGGDIVVPNRDLTAELLVPPTTNARAATALKDVPALLARASGLADSAWQCARAPGSWLPPPAAAVFCDGVAAGIRSWSPSRVVVVYQRTAPAVSAPLGWVLSAASRAAMDAALDDERAAPCSGPATPGTDTARRGLCRHGYGNLGDLVQTVLGNEPAGP